MKNTFFGLMLMAGGMFAFSSCSNDIAEEAMEDFTQGVQSGTPMNFALDFGGKSQNSSKRYVKYDDPNDTQNAVAFAWEVGDQIGVECPDAEIDNEDLGRTGRASRGLYQVKSTTNRYNRPNYVQDLEALGEEYLYWSQKDLHRVFTAYPAGRITLTSLTENDNPEDNFNGTDFDFTRGFITTIDHEQKGTVQEEKIKVGNNVVDGLRCADKNNMICIGWSPFYRSATSSGAELYISMYSCFTSLDVIFNKENDPKNVTIKSVSVKVSLPENSPVKDFAISGECTGKAIVNENFLLSPLELHPTTGKSYDQVTLTLNENGYTWNQQKPLSTVLIMFPWPEPVAGAAYFQTFPATLKVVYQYEGEDEQIKYMNISGQYGINARNRVIVPHLPHKNNEVTE